MPRARWSRSSPSCGRWPVEMAIEESKGELGMDHYQVRGWTGWHHHMTMTFLSHHFLVRLRYRTQHQNYAAYCSHRRRTLRRPDSS